MKRLALLVTLVCAVAGSVAIANALAGTPNPVAQTTGWTCAELDGNGNLIFTNQSSDTLYQGGKEQEHCVGQGEGNGTVVVWTFANDGGILCGLNISGTLTDNYVDRVSKSGESQLTCYSDGFTGPSTAAVVGSTG